MDVDDTSTVNPSTDTDKNATRNRDHSKGGYEVFATELQSDRLIEIFVGTDNSRKPYKLQQKLLESVSGFFARVLKRGHFVEGQQGRLRFPDDHIEAWEVLLYWMMHHRLPDEIKAKVKADSGLIAIHCWAIGDKYYVPQFQDEAMFVLLDHYTRNLAVMSSIKEAVAISAPSSQLRNLMAEELVYLLTDCAWRSQCLEKLDELEGLGFMREMMTAYTEWASDIRDHERCESRIDGRMGIWKDFMVGDWPQGHHLLRYDM